MNHGIPSNFEEEMGKAVIHAAFSIHIPRSLSDLIFAKN